MFGFLKNLLRKPPETPADNYQETTTQATATPAAQPKAPVFKAPPLRNPGTTNGHAKGIEVSLQAVLQGLPLELQPRIRRNEVGEASITVPLEKVLAQLSRGAVKVSFGELRQAAPDVFTAQNDRDRVLVCLPLAEILAKLNPALIARRRVQRQIEVPPEISSPFDPNGRSTLTLSNPKSSTEHPPAQPPARQSHPAPASSAPARGGLTTVQPLSAPEAAPTPAPPRFAPPQKPAASPISHAPATPQPAPASVSPQIQAAPHTPASPPRPPAQQPAAPPRVPFNPKPTFTKPASPIEASPIESPAPAPIAFTPPPAPPAAPRPAAPIAREPLAKPAPITPAAPEPAIHPTPVQANVTAATPAIPTKPTPPVEPLIVPLAALAEGWPEEIRKEIISLGLAEAKVGLPATGIEQALKQGKISFSWIALRSWIKPAIPGVTSAHDNVALELPLKVVAPLFLERQRQAAKAKQKVSVDEDIPNLFFGFPQPEPTPSQLAAVPRPTDTNYYVWEETHDTVKSPEKGPETESKRSPSPGTKFVAKYATPNEVVSRAASLDGVAGALIALPDGLMVANRLPPDLNADTLAAFLPQIFGKVSQCTKELRMGELNNLNFTVGNVPWKIFRVNAIFFAAFGQAGVPLPTAQLVALAADLDHKSK